ncbi:hypothetical protein BMS3Abin09_00320 [bacterium BMS3Abin09]|nr:hypothetical protein BMS3Abin09_00320 [bacterium BMS3Abin09]
MPWGLKYLLSGIKLSMWGTMAFNMAMSVSMTSRIPGLCILTTTFSPVLSTALCTWAIDAAATGTSSKSSNNSSRGFPSSASIILLALSEGNGGTLSWSFLNSSAYSAVIRSGLEESICANLIKEGPSSLNAILSLWGMVCLSTSFPLSNNLNLFLRGIKRWRFICSMNCPKPWRRKTLAICLIRLMFLYVFQNLNSLIIAIADLLYYITNKG